MVLPTNLPRPAWCSVPTTITSAPFCTAKSASALIGAPVMKCRHSGGTLYFSARAIKVFSRE
ncbi:hypothetical protein D3C84_1238930 [compost metagenome]